MTTQPEDPFRLIGATLADKYRVDRIVGEGGFGVVYSGFHLLIGQAVAIKVMKPAAGSPAEQQRVTDLFLREARVLFSLTHPSIVRMYDVGTLTMSAPTPAGAWAPSVPYVVLEYIDGCSLQDEIRRRRDRGGPHFARHEVATIMTQVLDAVAFAHERGVVHRDIKPSNVMLPAAPGQGAAKVVDFGIASVASGAETTTGAPFTPIYAAPEQWDAALGRVGPATDIFALGLLLVEICTLTKAFPFDSLAQVVGAVMDDTKRPSIEAARADLPGLDAIVRTATQVRPALRFPSVRAMKEHLLATIGASQGQGTQPLLVAVPSVAPSPVAFTAPLHDTGARTGPTAPAVSVVATLPSAERQSPRSSVGKIVVAVAGILSLTVLVGITIVAGFAYKACVDQPWLQPPTADEASPAPTGPPKPVPPTKGWLYIGSVQAGHFWTEHQIRTAVEPSLRDFEVCYESNVPEKERFEGDLILMVHPTTTGAISEVSCDLIVGGKRIESELCSCVEGKAAAISVPRPSGRVGLLRTGPFVVTLKTRKTARATP